MDKLPRSFYLRPTIAVAKDLLGKYLVRHVKDKMLVGMIVETEAYIGKNDPASHAYRGKTKRNAVMFGEGGHLYVYFTYGMHFCANVVTDIEGVGSAVLLRAVEPVEGYDIMSKMRKLKGNSPQSNLTNGPAKLCEAFGINGTHNGTDLLGNSIFITKGEKIRRSDIVPAVRIGIRNGADKLWRFYLKGNPFVSKLKIPASNAHRDCYKGVTSSLH